MIMYDHGSLTPSSSFLDRVCVLSVCTSVGGYVHAMGPHPVCGRERPGHVLLPEEGLG